MLWCCRDIAVARLTRLLHPIRPSQPHHPLPLTAPPPHSLSSPPPHPPPSSQVGVPPELSRFIHDSTVNFGKVKVVLKHNRFWVESPDKAVLDRLAR